MAAQDVRYGSNVDLQGLQLKNHRLDQQTADPGILNTGTIWYDSITNIAKVYDGSAVRPLYVDDDNFHTLPQATGVVNADELLIADSTNAYAYKRISKQDLFLGVSTVLNSYYRIIAEAGTANLDASGSSIVFISGDGANLQTYGDVTSTNTLSIIFKNQSANKILAGPTSGGAAYPTFRAFVANDMPIGYNSTAWDIAYAHAGIVTGNPHAVTALETGAEVALGNPASNGYLLSSTTAGVRSWVDPNLLGGNALATLVITPTAGEDGYSVTWDDTAQEYVLTNVTGGAGGITASGTPVAAQIGVWASVASMLGDSALLWDTATDTIYTGVFTGDSSYVSNSLFSFFAQRDGSNPIGYATYSNTYSLLINTSYYRYGGTIAAVAAAPTDAIIHGHYYSAYDGSGEINGGSIVVSVDGAVAVGSFDTKMAFSVRGGASSFNVLILESDKVSIPAIQGTGTGTSMVYYNRSTGELTYADGPTGSAPAYGTDLQVPFMNGTTAFQYSSAFVHDGNDLTLTAIDSFPLLLQRDTSTVSSSFGVRLRAKNSASVYNDYAFIVGLIESNTSGAEYGKLDFHVDINSTMTRKLRLDQYGLTLEDALNFHDTNTQVWEDGSGNLSFKDAVLGSTKTLSQLASSAGVIVGSGDNIGNVSVFSNTGEISGYSGFMWSDASKQLSITAASANDYSIKFVGSVDSIFGYDHSEAVIKFMAGTTLNTSSDADVIFYFDTASHSFVLGTHSKARSPKLWVYENAAANAAAYIENVSAAGGDVLILRMSHAAPNKKLIDAITISTSHFSGDGAGTILAPNIEHNYYVKVIEVTHADDGTPITIASLTAGDIAWWGIQIHVTTAFDSSTPQLRIGNSAHTDVYYKAASDVGLGSTGWKTTALSNDPDSMTGAEDITCQYNDASADGTQGTAYIYLFYSRH